MSKLCLNLNNSTGRGAPTPTISAQSPPLAMNTFFEAHRPSQALKILCVLFGFSAFSAAPISSLSGGVVYDGAATIASTSAASCYAIRYAFGGATIVGVSTVSASGVRYAFGAAQINAVSAISASANRIYYAASSIDAVSALTANAVRYAITSFTITANSELFANAIFKAVCISLIFVPES